MPKSASEILVSVNGLCMMREQRLVLQEVSWQVKAGEHHFILGNNGSGKTTLLELVMGFLWPDSGVIEVLGRRYGEADLREVRRHFGYLSPWLLARMRPHWQVEEVIASGAEGLIGKPEKISAHTRKRARALLKLFALEGFHHRAYGSLSSGEQMRVLLARALIHTPRILVLDEPFAHLDVHARLNMYLSLERLVRKQPKLSVLLVTHHLQDVLPFFTHGVLLYRHRAHVLPKQEALKSANLAAAFGLTKQLAKHLHLTRRK